MTSEPSPSSQHGFLDRMERLLRLLFFVLLYTTVILYGFAPQLIYPDMGWHLAQGEWMVHHHAFLRQDVFNYPVLHAPLVNEYPFYQIVIWLAWRFGEIGAAALCSFLLALILLIIHRGARKLSPPEFLFAPALLFCVLLAITRATLRPEIVTSLGIVLFMVTLLLHREANDWKKIWPLALFQIVWINSHSGFILGPALTIGFGVELTLRHWLHERKFPLATFRTWAASSLLIVLACFANPYGLQRLLLPFYHQGSEIIRAYVTEMQPLAFNTGDFFVQAMILELLFIAAACLVYRGGLCWTFLLVTLFFFKETFVSQRHMAVFAMLVPGTLLSAAAFGRRIDFTAVRHPLALRLAGNIVLLTAAMGALLLVHSEFTPTSALSPFSRWRAWQLHRVEMPVTATAWLRENQIAGRLLHRSEIGGWLQYHGYNHAETFADTGFGKYNESFIHEIGLLCERPGTLPQFIQKYNPNAVVLANMAYNWPVVLRHEGWRCVYYAVDSSVWLPPGIRPELAALSDDQILKTFHDEIRQNGLPVRIVFHYRQLLALQSMGYEDVTWEALMNLPQTWKQSSLFWETAAKLAFTNPPLSDEHRDALYDLAQKDEFRNISLNFRAACLAQKANWPGVVALLSPLSRHLPNDGAFTLLAQAYLQQGDYENAASLLRQNNLFDLRNGRRYQYLAQCEGHFNNRAAALAAWKQALFYFPDDPDIRAGASN
jgi:hypothetical protein